MFHVDVASAYVAMRRIPYKIINECHSKCFAAILAESPASTGERPRPQPHPHRRRHSYRLSALSAYLASILSETDGCLNALFEQQCLSFLLSLSLPLSLAPSWSEILDRSVEKIILKRTVARSE